MRSIIETLMMDIMFEIPSRSENAKKVRITEETVETNEHPLFYDENGEMVS